MASRRNPQTTIINSSSSSISVVVNPSSTAFLYVWHLMITASAASNIQFQQQTLSDGTANLSGAYDLTGAGGSLTWPDANSPWLTIDPGATLIISNSGSASVQGQVLWSN
jgi:hypothetical protein